MKVALAVWNRRISPVFDVSRQFVILEIHDDSVARRRTWEIRVEDPLQRVDQLFELGVEILICGAISRSLLTVLEERGMKVIPFTAGGIEEIIEAFRLNNLLSPELAMPGCGPGQRENRTCRGSRSGRGSEGKRRWTMPQGDGTGPRGKGPETGRRRGLCRSGKKQVSEGWWSSRRMTGKSGSKRENGTGGPGTGKTRNRKFGEGG